MEAYETIEVGEDIEVRIIQDTDAESPREWGTFGKMVCWHRRYNLGDEQPKKDREEYLEWLAFEADPELEEIKERVDRIWNHFYPGYQKPERLATKIADQYLKQRIEKSLDENYVMMPLYLYDHSGLIMRTGGFSCPWDSGKVGIIYATREEVCKECGEWTAESIEQAERIMAQEVETYSQYLEGDVWGYEVVQKHEDGTEDILDSCWGFFGDDFCKEEAMRVAGKYEYDSSKSFVNYL